MKVALDVLKKINSALKGFRTFLFAFCVAAEPILAAAMTGEPDFNVIGRQLLIAVVVVGLRAITTTPPGKR